MKLPFRKDKELCRSLHAILGFYPGRMSLYREALLHKSSSIKEEKGGWQNNERLEFLGDAVLDAVVGDIVYRRFEGKREGFLTNARSKLVQRESLNRIAHDIGLDRLIKSSSHSTSHNSNMAGNAFEALVGAIYLDRGYEQCMKFMEKRILKNLVNIDKVAYKEVNFKSKLLEWSQKKRINLSFKLDSQTNEDASTPVFTTSVIIEGINCGTAKGYSKKESQQQAAKIALSNLRKKRDLESLILRNRDNRLGENPEEPKKEEPKKQESPKKKEEPKKQESPKKKDEPKKEEPKKQDSPKKKEEKPTKKKPSPKPAQSEAQNEPDNSGLDIDFSDVTMREKTRDEIIAQAEAQAWAEEVN